MVQRSVPPESEAEIWFDLLAGRSRDDASDELRREARLLRETVLRTPPQQQWSDAELDRLQHRLQAAVTRQQTGGTVTSIETALTKRGLSSTWSLAIAASLMVGVGVYIFNPQKPVDEWSPEIRSQPIDHGVSTAAVPQFTLRTPMVDWFRQQVTQQIQALGGQVAVIPATAAEPEKLRITVPEAPSPVLLDYLQTLGIAVGEHRVIDLLILPQQ